MKTFLRIFFAVAVIVVLVYWFAGHKIYEFAILKMLAIRAETIAPNREVVWEPGPVAAEVPVSARPPNIIVILADDLGYNDLTFNGGGVANGAVPTPHIDSLAREGIKFTNGYANNATCSPSRAAIVTGRYATRFGFEFTPTPPQFAKVVHRLSPRTLYFEEREENLMAYENMGLPAKEVTIAELLKKKGYHTLMLGKWHLGGAPDTQPQAHGFDEWLGFVHATALFMPKDSPEVVNSRQDFDAIDKFLWVNLSYAVSKDGGEQFQPKGYLTDYLTDEAIKAIEAN